MTRTSRNTVRALGVGAAAFALALAAPAMASAHEGENNKPTCGNAEMDYVGETLTFNVADGTGCEDKDGDELTITGITGFTGIGSAEVGGDKTSVVYTGTDALDGSASFTALVTDGHDGEPTEWNIKVNYEIAFELIATDDAFTTKVNTPATGNVVSTDKGADRATISLLSEPQHGKLDFDEKTGDFTYTPDKDWSGTDTFTYQLKAGKFTDSATVTIKVSPEGGAGGPGTSPSPSPSKTKGPLAKTGSSLTTLGLIGGGVLIAGAGALFVARRRREV
ncbi:MAG TPA: Ig-like domain-containing protein [Phytomonospora sp.]